MFNLSKKAVHTISYNKTFLLLLKLRNCFSRLVYRTLGNVHFSIALFILHGVGEHIGAYDGLAEALTQRGVLVCGHDQGNDECCFLFHLYFSTCMLIHKYFYSCRCGALEAHRDIF